MLRSLIVEISGSTSGLERALSSASGGLQSFAQRAQQVGTTLTAAISAPLALIGKTAIQAFGEMDGLRRGLGTLEKDAGSLTKRLAEMREVAKLPGLGVKEAIQFDVSLRSAGFSADLSKRSMIAFGNALATVGKGKNELKGLSVQLQQLATKTGGFGADLRIIKEYAPQTGAALMKAFGTIDTEAIAKAGFTGKQVVEKIVGELEKLPAASGSAKNAFENFGDTMNSALDGLGASLFKGLHIGALMDTIGETVTKLTEKFSKLPATSQTLIAAFGAILVILPPLIAGIGFFTTTVLPALRAGMIAVRTAALFMTGPIGLIAAAVAVAATLIIMHWDKVKKFLVDMGIWDALKNIVKTALGFVTSVFGAFINLLQGDWHNFGQHLLNTIKYIGNGIISVFQFLLQATGGILAQIASLFGVFDNPLSKAIKSGVQKGVDFLNSVKFKIDAPAFNMFDGFQFGGDGVTDGNNATNKGKDKKKKTKAEVENYDLIRQYEAAQKELTDLQTRIDDFTYLGVKPPQDVLNRFRELTDELKRTKDALDGIKASQTPLKSTITQERVQAIQRNPTPSLRLNGLINFQTDVAKQIQEQRVQSEAELRQFRANLSTFPFFLSDLGKEMGDLGGNIFNYTGDQIRKSVEKLALVLQQAKEAMTQGAIDAFGGLAEGLAAATVDMNSGKEMLRGVLKSIIDLIANQAIAIGSAMIVTAIPMLSSLVLAPLGTKQMITGGALVAAGGIAKGLAATAFADGGTVSGPTYSLTGEYANARMNPEFVAPVNKGAGMIAKQLTEMGAFGGGGGTLTATLRGEDIQLSLDRYNRNKRLD